METETKPLQTSSTEKLSSSYTIRYCYRCDSQRTHHKDICDTCKNGNGFVTTEKKKRAFRNILFGIKKSRILKRPIRFLTLTTSDIEFNSLANQEKNKLSKDFLKLKGRIKRCSPYKLYKQGYISKRQLTYYYGHDYLSKSLKIEYLKVTTNEANGVIHAIYRGEYLPYNYVADNWQDIHNSWEINIQLIDDMKKNDLQVTSYIVNQYVTNQEKATCTRYSQTINWIYKHYLDKWNEIREHYSPPLLYDVWDTILYDNTYVETSLNDFI
jgi:hypothetical protein